jgi:hypothetical protein
MNLEEKILKRIEQGNIKPKNIWYFIARDWFLWFLVGTSVLFSALTLAPIIFILVNIETEFAYILAPNFIIFILSFFPWFWFLLSFLSILLSRLAWKNTKHGYKFSGLNIFSFSLFLALTIALLLNMFGNLPKRLDDSVGRYGIGFTESFENRRRDRWNQKEAGRVFGKVVSTSSENFSLERRAGNKFEVINFMILPETIGTELIDNDNFVRVLYATDSIAVDKLYPCIVLEDKFTPPKVKGTKRTDLLTNIFPENSPCKKTFETKKIPLRSV